MADRSFAVTWDYRCPFAAVAHDHVVTALEAGAPWDVAFVPFSLDQVHVAEGDTAVWEDPTKRSALLAMQAGIVVRDRFPDRFHGAHTALFAARHAHSRDLRDEQVVRSVLQAHDVDVDAVFAEIDDGWPLEAFRKEHEHAVDHHSAFGVPTFVAGDRAVFVRLMRPADGDAESARTTIERILDMLVGWPALNEFKLARLDR